MVELVFAKDVDHWKELLGLCTAIDVCHAAAFHTLYAGRIPDAQALMFVYEHEGDVLCYPFLLTPIVLDDKKSQKHPTEFKDVSSAYGYTGPLSSTNDATFLSAAWQAFDDWAASENVIAEFIRFSPIAENTSLAHADCTVLSNRPLAISRLPENAEDFLSLLPSKTRNMVRKAWKSDLLARELPLAEGLPAFRALYEETMDRNAAVGFFLYDDAFYECLHSFPESMVRLFGVYSGDKLISSAMALVLESQAYYFLGASLREFSSLGAGNLALYAMSTALIDSGVSFINVGGGRGTTEDDPLFKFKKSNGTEVIDFKIGKRVLNQKAYNSLIAYWEELNSAKMDSPKVLFYREY